MANVKIGVWQAVVSVLGTQRRKKEPAAQAAPNMTATAVKVANADDADRNNGSRTPRPETGDVAPRVESTRCDDHPLYILQPVSVEFLLPGCSEPTKQAVSRCPKAGCHRHYVPELGYFILSGEERAFHAVGDRRTCAVHEDRHMAVAKASGEFLWACLESGCTRRAPYEAPDPATRNRVSCVSNTETKMANIGIGAIPAAIDA